MNHDQANASVINQKKNNHNQLLQKNILTTKEAAKLLRVTVQTIKNYIYEGKIKSFKTPGGHHRILKTDLLPFIKETLVTELKNGADQLHKNHLTNGSRLYATYISTIKAFLSALDARDAITTGHSERVLGYSLGIADRLGISSEERKNLELAALLHDIGKIGISEQILAKPGPLTAQEFSAVKRHSEIGEEMLKDIDFLKEPSRLIRHHHERYDGLGYPDGLKAEEIPLGSRIIFVAEAYDALTSSRSYRPAKSRPEAISELKNVADKQLDGRVVKAMLAAVHPTSEVGWSEVGWGKKGV